MLLQGYCDNTWLYPDTTLTAPGSFPALSMARNAHTALQILGDTELTAGTKISVSLDCAPGVKASLYQLLPTRVEENSGRLTHTADSYEEVADFVTRKAPFDVYDVTVPLKRATVRSGRLALFIRLEASADAEPGDHNAVLTLNVGDEIIPIKLSLFVSRAVVPSLDKARLGVVNWLFPEDIAGAHMVEPGSDAFWMLVDSYMDNQLELRSGHLKLPSGEPVRDADGKVVDFDFSFCEQIGKLALTKGYSYIYGGFVARFKVWNEPDQYLLWDRDITTSSVEGYRQLKIYFTKLWKVVTDNGWQNQWMQCLVDEPQFPNSESYRALSGICRKCMPGVTIHDPVETTEIGGATDIWCVKQAVYDKHRETFDKLQAMGEELWVYTCGFPAGKWMNRATDLPLLAGRLPFWLCARLNFGGFLHWGYNAYGKRDPFLYNCFATAGKPLPPGNGFIVYPGPRGPWNSVRSQGQLFGAEDAEVLKQLPMEKIAQFCDPLCSDFENYTTDTELFAKMREAALRAF